VCVAILPHETDPVLIVDSDAVLPSPVSAQGFETVAWEGPQVIESSCRVQLSQLALHDPSDAPETLRRVTLEQRLGVPIPEGPDHPPKLLRIALYVKRYTQ
jgi:hypothetical protein